MLNLQLIFLSYFGRINTPPCLSMTKSFVFRNPGNFQIPKLSSYMVLAQVSVGRSSNVQLKVAFPFLLTIKGLGGPDTILGRLNWHDTEWQMFRRNTIS